MRIADSKAQSTYSKFDEFVAVFLAQKKSFFHSVGEDRPLILTALNLDQCIDKFVKGAIEGKVDEENNELNFQKKAAEQFKVASSDVKDLFAHAIWLWCFAVQDMTKKGKVTAVNLLSPGLVQEKDFDKLGFVNGGTYHKQNKPNEIAFILLVLKCIIREDLRDASRIKGRIIEIVKGVGASYDSQSEQQSFMLPDSEDHTTFKPILGRQNAIGNILLHLCDPDRFEEIVSNGHKRQVVLSFEGLLEEASFSDEASTTVDIDEKIFRIREVITKVLGRDFTFYEREITALWNPTESSLDTHLAYKKAIVLYGPPGTSKTYSANKLAQNLIVTEFLRTNKANGVAKLLDEKIRKDLIANHTHHFQLHSSLTYEDFIVGYQLRNGATEVQQGKLLRVINEIKEKDNGLPHVIILDEINRVDLSRLFGELFSAIESRGKEIVLPIGHGTFTLCVPENVYFIGTMNEIDFSLERVDFALRRRFLWQFMGFNEDLLREMIEEPLRNLRINGEAIEDFITSCKAVNKLIDVDRELGKQYQIGHAIFAEINGVVQTFQRTRGRSKNLKETTNILWDISIRPLLEAYYGNSDAAARENSLKKYEEAFAKK